MKYLIIIFGLVAIGYLFSEFLINQYQNKKIIDLFQKIEIIKKQQEEMQKQIDELKTSYEMGEASWYDYELLNGWSSKGHRVCASRTFPRYSYVQVINVQTGDAVVCYITDFGPSKELHPERIIDMSSHAFSFLAPIKQGIIPKVLVKRINTWQNH